MTSQEEPLPISFHFQNLNGKSSVIYILSCKSNLALTSSPSSHTARHQPESHAMREGTCSALSPISPSCPGALSPPELLGHERIERKRGIDGHLCWWINIPSSNPRHMVGLHFPVPMWLPLANDMWAWIPLGWVEMDMENGQGIYYIVIKR